MAKLVEERDFRSDLELARASASGDQKAFEELYLRHHRVVYSLCLRMLHNTHTAEDLTQDVFIQLFRKIGTFKGKSKFSTWLYRLTANQVLMYFRKKITLEEPGREPDTVIKILEQTRVIKPDDSVTRVDIQTAIAELPKGYHDVFVLHDIEGYEHEEVARILGCSTGTSKSQLHKARLNLRVKLKRKKPGKVFDWTLNTTGFGTT